MAQYVDGFILPVPESGLETYLATARKAADIWREHGALEVRECVADDVKMGELTSFPRSVKVEDGETVIFSWITYESREARDAINKKVMADPRIDFSDPSTMPFDTKRMIYGGFQTILDL